MKIYSGEVCLGEVGTPTPHIDAHGNLLHVGDIVLIYTKDYAPDGLTAIVQDGDGFFAMGIKIVMTTGEEDGSKWMVRRVKSHADVVDGEHWRDYGFSYRSN